MRKNGMELDTLWLFILIVVTISFWMKVATANEPRVIKLDEKKIGVVYVSFGKSTILSFPAKPSKVVLGNRGAFTLEYIENDLALAALNPRASSNLFVYVQGRRFAFDLVTRAVNPDEIVMVRDKSESSVAAKVKE
jgi:hypothetical protein